MYEGPLAKGVMGEALDEMTLTFSTKPPTIDVR